MRRAVGLGGGAGRGEEVDGSDPEDALQVGPSSRAEPSFLRGGGGIRVVWQCSGCEVSERALKAKIVKFLVVAPHLGQRELAFVSSYPAGERTRLM